MTDVDYRNLIRLTTFEEWNSMEKYLTMLMKSKLNVLKTNDKPEWIYRAQGASEILDNLSNIREISKQILENSNG